MFSRPLFSGRPTIELYVLCGVLCGDACHVNGWSYCTLDNDVLMEVQILFRGSYRMCRINRQLSPFLFPKSLRFSFRNFKSNRLKEFT